MGNNIKTLPNDASVEEFLDSIDSPTKREDSFALLELYKKYTGCVPKMWGSSIVGFGEYHYKSDRSRQEGDWPLAAFSPRKQYLTLYIMTGFKGYQDLLKQLGKHKTSVSCLYINKLSDIDEVVLARIVKQSYLDAKAKFT